jgi:hypothetical protein
VLVQQSGSNKRKLHRQEKRIPTEIEVVERSSWRPQKDELALFSSSSSLLFPLVSGSAFFHAKESCIDHPSFHYFTREKKVNRKRRPEKGEDRFGTRSRSRACMYSVVSGGGAKERGESERMTGMVEEKKVKIESACISTALNEKGEETEDAQTTTQIPYR